MKINISKFPSIASQTKNKKEENENKNCISLNE